MLQTGIFKPDEINREVNQKVQKKIPLFNHQKKIAGRPSIGNISSGGQALEYAAQKFAATPTTGRYVAKNYADVLNDIGHCITGTAIKEASRPLKKSRVETVPLQKVDDCAKALAYTPADEKSKLGQRVLATGIFEPGQLNRNLNQRIKKRVPIFEHQKKISGRPSIGDIESGDQALKYAGRKAAATPTTGRYVVNNYANMLNENGHCITGIAIKVSRLKLHVDSPQHAQVELIQIEEEPTYPDHFAGSRKELLREAYG